MVKRRCKDLEDLYNELQSFLSHETTTTMEIDQLRRYISYRPQREQEESIVSSVGLTERLELIHTLFNDISRDSEDDHFAFTAQQLALLLVQPLNCLQAQIPPKNWYHSLPKMIEIVIEFGSSRDTKLELDQTAIDDTCLRDNESCVITGQQSDWVVPIFTPFNCSHGTYLSPTDEALEVISMFLPSISFLRFKSMLSGDKGIAGEKSNMMTISKSLHHFWLVGSFGLVWKESFKIEGQSLSEVHLQLRVLPRRKKNAERFVDLADLEPQATLVSGVIEGDDDQERNPPQPPTEMVLVDFASHRRLCSGDMIILTVPTRYVNDMKIFFDLRWAFTCILALSGDEGTEDE